MSAKQHVVKLSEQERQRAERVARSNKASIRERMRARILLGAQEAGGQSDAQVAAKVGASELTVWRVRRRFAQRGLEGALCHGAQAKRKARRLDGSAEAHLVALVCGAPPEGHQRWTLQLLRGRLIVSENLDTLSAETVRQTLKKMRSSPG